MKKLLLLTLIQILIGILPVMSQSQKDSLIRFSDLRYHSAFEKDALRNFVKYRKDTFYLFLAIDEKITAGEAIRDYKTYRNVFNEFSQKAVESKNINKKIRISYSGIHSNFLKKYNDNEYFPVIFQSGTYNCVSASMLYSLAFNKLDIPFKVMASSNHVYLIANPGTNSVVIETTNPGFEKTIFNGDFQQRYVDYLRSSKLISESEYKNKSVEEIFEEKFKEVKDAEFINLPGFQYYNKALSAFQNHDYEKALILCQKAYFFYPDNQVKALLNAALLFQIEKCDFENVTDIDYLAQLSRFENSDLNVVLGIFNNIILHKLQYTDKDAYCDSLHQRLVSQLSNKKTIEEINFAYNMQMSYRYQNSDKVEKFITAALELKGNHNNANIIMGSYLTRKLFSISDSYALLDTISRLEQKYNYEMLKPVFTDHRLRAYLQIASDQFNQNKIAAGEKSLMEFENKCMGPIKNQMLSKLIELTYHSIVMYYLNEGNKPKARSYVSRGLKFVQNSRLLESAVH